MCGNTHKTNKKKQNIKTDCVALVTVTVSSETLHFLRQTTSVTFTLAAHVWYVFSLPTCWSGTHTHTPPGGRCMGVLEREKAEGKKRAGVLVSAMMDGKQKHMVCYCYPGNLPSPLSCLLGFQALGLTWLR